MSEAKHTPGPWCISEAENSFEIIQDYWSDDGDHLGEVVVRAPEIDPENGGILNKADAILIAAAPELLAALKQCRLALEPYDDVKPRDWKTDREKLAFTHQAARAAIAKVEGSAA